MTDLAYVTDQATGLAYVRQRGIGVTDIRVKGFGLITYRCHSCGELIPKPWEVLFVDPVDWFASPILPYPLPPTLTTHHTWHSED